MVRAFVELRESLVAHKALANRLDELELSLEGKLKSHDEAIAAILSAIRQLMVSPQPRRRPIGFTATQEE